MGMNDILAFLEQHKRNPIALVSHPRPDGDALGSLLGLRDAMRGVGFTVDTVNAFPITDKLRFIAPPDALVTHSEPDWHRRYGCLGVLDCGELSRLDEINRAACLELPTFNIDHHASSKGVGQARWIESDASSVAEMIVRLCHAAGWPLTPFAAEALWTGIATDTGRFSFDNTSSNALMAADLCLKAGARPSRVAENIYQSVSPAERVLQARTLTRMRLGEGGKLAYSWLGRQDFLDAGVGSEGTQDMINLLRDTAGVEVALFLYEPPDASGPTPIKASLRTAVPYNAIDVAAQFGGGGHMRAAGCSLAGPLDAAVEKVVAAARQKFFA